MFKHILHPGTCTHRLPFDSDLGAPRGRLILSVRGQVGVGKKPYAFQRPTAPRQPVGPAGQLGAHQTRCIMSPPSCSRGWPLAAGRATSQDNFVPRLSQGLQIESTQAESQWIVEQAYSQHLQYLEAIKSSAKDLSLPIFEIAMDRRFI